MGALRMHAGVGLWAVGCGTVTVGPSFGALCCCAKLATLRARQAQACLSGWRVGVREQGRVCVCVLVVSPRGGEED